jgi:DNA-binding NtrC family response regulator
LASRTFKWRVFHGSRGTRSSAYGSDALALHFRASSLKHQGYQVLTSTSGHSGLHLMSGEVVDAVVIDFDLDHLRGPHVVAEIKRLRPSTRVILLAQDTELPEGTTKSVDSLVPIAGEPESLLKALEEILPQRPAHNF